MPASLLKTAIVIAALLLVATGSASAAGTNNATDWIEGHNFRMRLVFGGRPSPDGQIERYAGLELALPPGWKTYWRQPGSAGGIPPSLDWSASTNVAAAALQFPAPTRFVDSTGHTIGYKGTVVLPLSLSLINPRRPADLDLKVFFGVCREICIPAEAAFAVTIEPDDFTRWPPGLAAALEKLPVPSEPPPPDAVPTVKRIAPLARSDGQRALMIDIHYPAGNRGADLFVERGDGMGLAMTEAVARPSPEIVRFRLPVEDAAEWAKLGETGLVLTMVSETGPSSTARRPRP